MRLKVATGAALGALATGRDLLVGGAHRFAISRVAARPLAAHITRPKLVLKLPDALEQEGPDVLNIKFATLDPATPVLAQAQHHKPLVDRAHDTASHSIWR